MTILAEHWCHGTEWMPWHNWMLYSAPKDLPFLHTNKAPFFFFPPSLLLSVEPSNEITERRKSTCLHGVGHLGPILLKRTMAIQQRSKISTFISVQIVLWKAIKISAFWYKNDSIEKGLEFLPWNSSKSYSYRFSGLKFHKRELVI